jgi:hypothetical protein
MIAFPAASEEPELGYQRSRSMRRPFLMDAKLAKMVSIMDMSVTLGAFHYFMETLERSI